MPSTDLFNSLIVPLLLVALVVFFARRSLLWMLRELLQVGQRWHLAVRAKLQLRMLLLERHLAQRHWRDKR